MTRQYVETAAVPAALMIMKMATLFLPSVCLSLTMQMIQEKIAVRTDEGTDATDVVGSSSAA